jgi:outer membrane scaffolding protein for murein synthesis (MipA/OmpV family)
MRPNITHVPSVPPGAGQPGAWGRLRAALWVRWPRWALLWAGLCLPAVSVHAQAPAGAAPEPALRLGALGLSMSTRPAFAGAAQTVRGFTPQFLVQRGRFSLSNGGPLASRAGEPAEGGLAADVLAQDRLSLRASLLVDAGRKSADTAHLRGLHDIPAHLRGRVHLAWRLAPRWELIGVWQGDLSRRGTGNSAEAVVLHEWRPAFLDGRGWQVSAGVAAQWRDARQANLVHGVSESDARQTPFAPYQLEAGLTSARVFAHARRELGGPWVAYGSAVHEALLDQAARSPITQRTHGFSLSLGLGRRF